ncbi:uncharacterized protein LOC111014271 [Momordica charantia]|uniref:Uncharacterized protein LOC111014271 n=1 Tax=Momordica charantia TaxID=3673 RepID=A0A6J1CTZ6_MOMCH|nr:uncharacterized protein LOC111014271 [Momordica charantia]
MRRSIASCYSDHAVKVSDSYCSGPSRHGYVVSKLPSPNFPHSVSSIYRPKISTNQKNQILILLSWSSDQMGQGFTIKINSISDRILCSRGVKSFKFSENSEISVYWDLSEARFEPGPDPSSGFYVAVTVDSEIGLLIGDEREKLEKLGVLKPNWETQLPEFCEIFGRRRRARDSGEVRRRRRTGDEESDAVGVD